MPAELELVVLRQDLPAWGLKAGDIGTVVHAYSDALAFEVEFADGNGDTVAVVTLEASQVRGRAAGEVLHARALESAS